MEFIQWALQNGYTDNLSIDRKDTNGDYCPKTVIGLRKQNRPETSENRGRIEPGIMAYIIEADKGKISSFDIR